MSLIFINFFISIPDYISLAVEKNSTIAYLTICLAMFLENIIPPIPSEIIMPLGGFFVYQQKLNFYILVFWGLLGTILGSLPWYYLGKLVNEKRLANFLDKKGKFLGISLSNNHIQPMTAGTLVTAKPFAPIVIGDSLNNWPPPLIFRCPLLPHPL